MGQDECSLVLHFCFKAQADRADSFGAVSEQRDRVKNCAERQLAASEDCAGSCRELVLARLAFEFATRGDLIDRSALTARTERLSITLRIANGYEGSERFFVGHANDTLNTKRPRSRRKKKMLLRLTLQCVTFASDMMILSKNGKQIRIKYDDVGIIRNDILC